MLQHILPTLGPGALTNRENATSDKTDSSILGPVTDFYKKLALECSGMQVRAIYTSKFTNRLKSYNFPKNSPVKFK